MKVAYVILTCEAYWETRAVWQRSTSLASVSSEDIYYLGHRMDPEERLFSWGAADDYTSCPRKLADFFVHSQLDYDWFFFLDDDTYVYVDRLLQRLRALDPTSLYTEGSLLEHLADTQWGCYHSGGAGTVLSKQAYLEIQRMLRRTPREEQTPHQCGDICLGQWSQSITGMQMAHCSNYHATMYEEGRDDPQTIITFHRVSEEELYRVCHSLSYGASECDPA